MSLRIGRGTVPSGALLRPVPPRVTGIVHLGFGNFHRAHQAVHTAAALSHTDGPWGILGVASRSAEVADELRAQDLLYAVAQLSPEGTDVTVPGVHTGVLVGSQQPDEVLDAIAAADTAIVTITVTEHGYTYSPRTRDLDLGSELVRADLRGDAPPRTTIGQVVRGLQRRHRRHASPITVVSCDNLRGNGDQTRRLVGQFIAELPPAERDELAAWVTSSVTFPNTMVDRIVPTTSEAHRDAVRARLGVRDAVPVPAEPFSMWVMEDRFAAGRPAWEHGGALFTSDVESYELLKLRLLNGTHSLIAYLGALDGKETIPDAVAEPFVAESARRVLYDDYLPTLTVPEGIDIDDYVGELFARWANSALGHRTRQVGSDGSVKLAQRVPEPASHHLRSGRMPQHLALTVAAYLCCMAPVEGYDSNPVVAAMADPARPALVAAANRHFSSRSFVDAVLRDGFLGIELAEHSGFASRVAEFFDIITRHGPETAAREAGRAYARGG